MAFESFWFFFFCCYGSPEFLRLYLKRLCAPYIRALHRVWNNGSYTISSVLYLQKGRVWDSARCNTKSALTNDEQTHCYYCYVIV